MNRNTESYFSQVPQANIERSMVDLSVNHKLSGNFSRLIPFYVQEVLPGDTFNVSTSIVCRLQTLLSPVMDDAVCDISYFFVANRLTWDHWVNFMGENTQSAWLDPVTYTPPLVSYPVGGFDVGTIADYMGIPVGVQPLSDADKPLAFPFRAYAMIADTYYRDQNLTDPLNIPTGDANQTGSNGDSYINDVANGGKPFRVAKLHDYFTSCTPSPQRSTGPVSLGLIDPSYNQLEVYSGTSHGDLYRNVLQTKNLPMSFVKNSDVGHTNQTSYFERMGSGTTNVTYSSTANLTDAIVPNNLWADASGMLASITINELRLAFQLQRFYEKAALYGSRYRETLQAFFGVTSPDSRMMIPEYLGGKRIPIVIHQIANTAESTGSNLGDLGAMSNTVDTSDSFIKSFVEHGFVIGVMCLRTSRSYSQGLDRMWSRRTRESWYWPTFAHLGAQPCLKREIFLSSSATDNASAFGYQEAWAEYRHRRSYVSSEMRPGVTNSLAHWHFGDYYQSAPSLSDAWIREDPAVVDRALAVTSSVADQFFADIYVKNTATRPMPVYSIPGLIDHF